MLVDFESHAAHLAELISQGPDSVSIATYNIYAGILHDGNDVHEWGPKYRNEVHEILDALNKLKNVRILVGIPPLILCKEGCEDCVQKHYKWVRRFLAHTQKWKNIEWRYVENMHLKCNIFEFNGKRKGVVGGRNLSASNWIDLSFKITDIRCKVVAYIFNKIWSNALPASEENLDATVLTQMGCAIKEE
jgi:hypothetical protein